MVKANCVFKIGYLEKITNQVIEITEKDNNLFFNISGFQNGNEYSLNFTVNLSLKDLLDFKLNDNVDFFKYVDEGDIIFGKNRIYDLNAEIKMNLLQYLPRHFVLNILFKNDNTIGELELSFTI